MGRIEGSARASGRQVRALWCSIMRMERQARGGKVDAQRPCMVTASAFDRHAVGNELGKVGGIFGPDLG
jgi:hypothetical protein